MDDATAFPQPFILDRIRYCDSLKVEETQLVFSRHDQESFLVLVVREPPELASSITSTYDKYGKQQCHLQLLEPPLGVV